ncbi:MAG: hypothetical protein WC291_05450, partial [Thermodesulfovibrionales bacterium]
MEKTEDATESQTSPVMIKGTANPISRWFNHFIKKSDVKTASLSGQRKRRPPFSNKSRSLSRREHSRFLVSLEHWPAKYSPR